MNSVVVDALAALTAHRHSCAVNPNGVLVHPDTLLYMCLSTANTQPPFVVTIDCLHDVIAVAVRLSVRDSADGRDDC